MRTSKKTFNETLELEIANIFKILMDNVEGLSPDACKLGILKARAYKDCTRIFTNLEKKNSMDQ